MARTEWYDTRAGKTFYWGLFGATLIGVVASIAVTGIRVPSEIYVFGFLGASVYAFTSFAKRFDEDGRYRLKILSRTVAVFPLVTGVYLLVFAFPGFEGELSALNATGEITMNTTAGTTRVTQTARLVAGAVFLTGIYVSTTLQALGGLADRLLGAEQDSDGTDSDQDTD